MRQPLLCIAHHEEVDDLKTGEERYPPELLRKWKIKHEGANGPALAALGPISEEQLAELLVSVFTPPVERLEAAVKRLEETGTLNAASLAELRGIVNVLTDTAPGFDSRDTRRLAYAAEVFEGSSLSATARNLAYAAQVFENDESLSRTARSLAEAAQRMSQLM